MIRISKIIDRRTPDSNGEVSVKVVVRFDRNQRKTIDTGARIDPRFWDDTKRRIRPTHTNAVVMNALVNRGLKVVQGLAKIPKTLTAHVGRHTFLTHIAMKTGNVFTTMQLGGLVKIETAQQYIHVAESISRIGGLGNVKW